MSYLSNIPFYFSINIIVLVAITIYTSSTSYSYDVEDKIVGGNDISIQKVPFVICLAKSAISEVHKPIHSCGAAIIKRHWAITAAHCLYYLNDTKGIFVRGNTSYSDGRDSNYRDHSIIKFYTHERYDISIPFLYDIGLVKVKEPFDALYEKPIPISGRRYRHNADTIVSTFGWGVAVVSSVTFSATLKTANLILLDNKLCMWLYKIWYGIGIRPQHLCVGGKPNKNVCVGDSGGPLVQKRKLIGIVTGSGGECANNAVPVIYVKVSEFYNWIKKHVNKKRKKIAEKAEKAD